MQKGEIQKYATLRNFKTSTVQGTVEILDLYHFWQSNTLIALTIPKGKETVVYTLSAALWSGQGDSAQEKHSELSLGVVRVAHTCICNQI